MSSTYKTKRFMKKKSETFNWFIYVVGKMKEDDMSLLIQSLRF
jgi:hypothetical protein